MFMEPLYQDETANIYTPHNIIYEQQVAGGYYWQMLQIMRRKFYSEASDSWKPGLGWHM